MLSETKVKLVITFMQKYYECCLAFPPYVEGGGGVGEGGGGSGGG